MRSDIEIAQACELSPIGEIAEKAGIGEKYIEQYGKYKAKIDLSLLAESDRENGKLILVTAISPTPAGEGKTTTAIGLADALRRIGKNALIAMREPSLGPVFGIKGGAAGGGYAQVVPMEDINLHFTGDIHAISAANNLLCAMVDNHIYQGNELDIDPERVTLRRCVDMNDRQLRFIRSGLGAATDGVEREDGFDISVATEVMAIFCLADSLADLKARLERMVIGYTRSGKPVTAGDLNAAGAMTALLKDAIKPNLVQTLEGTPALVHGGPFANIAHGCNSVLATRMALCLADYTITEAGFGADLGAEKFLDIKCPAASLEPAAAVVVATVRALKMHGGMKKEELDREDLEALAEGIPNLERHVRNIREVWGLNCLVAINRFPGDTEAELELVRQRCEAMGAELALSEVWAKGGEGGVEMAEKLVELCEKPCKLQPVYLPEQSIREKIDTVSKKIYGASAVEYSREAEDDIARFEDLGYGALPVCIAKTQYSFSDNKDLLGAPEGFSIHVRSLRLSAGAGFVVALTGKVLTMPGLPRRPAAEGIDVDDSGKITGLF